MLTLEKNIIKEEYNAITENIYDSFFTSIQLVDAYAHWLKTALVEGAFQTKEQKNNVVQFLAKLNTQKELLEVSDNHKAMQKTKRASKSFARKTQLHR